MIKNFEEYINEDYFSKLASRKDNCTVRKENEITEDFVRSFILDGCEEDAKSITIRKDGNEIVVDIDGSFYMREDIGEIPFQFGTITGNFDCSHCKKITSLEGCPQKISGYFSCVWCKSLTSLEGCPKIVDRYFSCYGCGKKFAIDEVKLLCNVKERILV